jgi:hypothetical protein
LRFRPLRDAISALLSLDFEKLCLLIPDLHAHAGARRCDRQVAITQAPNQVERLLRRARVSQAHRVVGDVLLHRFTHLRRCLEEAIRRHQTVERLMRTLKVVRLNEQADPLLAIGEVVEHRARQELVPERLPEPLDLPERHRVLWSALDVLDAMLLQRGFEIRRPAPRCVLTTVVREQLLGRAVFRDAALECLHHELALLMMRDDVRDHEARVIVHEADEVEALMLAQQEREDVRLPHLHRPSALEPPRCWRLACCAWRRRHHSGFMQDATHLRVIDAKRLKATEHVANAP